MQDGPGDIVELDPIVAVLNDERELDEFMHGVETVGRVMARNPCPNPGDLLALADAIEANAGGPFDRGVAAAYRALGE